jgi:hypothetical protein
MAGSKNTVFLFIFLFPLLGMTAGLKALSALWPYTLSRNNFQGSKFLGSEFKGSGFKGYDLGLLGIRVDWAGVNPAPTSD